MASESDLKVLSTSSRRSVENAACSPSLRNGDVVEGQVEKVVYRGVGLMRPGGRIIFVRGVYPGERWRVRVTDVSRDYARGVGIEPLATNADRRPSACPVFPACGGCSHLDLNYAAQLRLKTAVLEDVFARAGVDWSEKIHMTPSPEIGWRSRASVHLERHRTILRMGFKEAASHRIIETADCSQLSKTMNAALSELRLALEPSTDLTRESRRVEIAESYDGESRIAAVIVDRMRIRRRRLDELMERLRAVDALGIVSVGPWKTHGIWSGVPHVFSRVRGFLFRIHACSFFQANRFLAEALVRAVESKVPGNAVVLDLFSGVGLFSVALASRMKRVLGVETNPVAIGDARVNARAAGLTNVEFLRGDAHETLAQLPRGDDEAVIVDPPRGGLSRGLVEHLHERRPSLIVYVSCDPPALARDIVRFERAGYELRSVDALDLFPGTFHFETVACLAR
jgi:23S rRNA (uracil1939-C5)-methyltransferase